MPHDQKSLYIIYDFSQNILSYRPKLRLGGEYVRDEMLCCAGESRNGFLCTFEGDEFLSSSFLHFAWLQRNFKFV